ncbi:MAG: phosphate signaling complex protein PhoU [Beijerinckiaceae bacterium]
MTDHTVKAYDEELDLIGANIAEMGGIAERMLVDAMDALSKLDIELAKRVVNSDPRLDTLQREIEDQIVRTIIRRQPVAGDLRELMASIHIAGDLERTGDLAKNIAKRAIKVADNPRVMRAVVGLKHMAEVAATQLKDVLDAYAQRDVERAKAVWSRDAELDALDDSIFRDLLTFMMEDPRNISFCTHLLFCAKNLERVGDHATNIAENVHFMVSGASLPMNRPKGE